MRSFELFKSTEWLMVLAFVAPVVIAVNAVVPMNVQAFGSTMPCLYIV